MEPVVLPKCLRVAEVAERLGIDDATVYRLAKSGALACYRIGGSIRIGEHHLRAYLESHEGWEGPRLPASGNSSAAGGGRGFMPTATSMDGLSGYRSKRKMSRAVGARSQTSKRSLKLVEG